MADVDVYPDYNPCNSTSCYNATYGPIIAQMPFEAGETGIQSNTTKVDQFLSWMDGQNSGYYAWAWDTWAGLISNYNGTAHESVGDRLQGPPRRSRITHRTRIVKGAEQWQRRLKAMRAASHADGAELPEWIQQRSEDAAPA